MGSTCAFDPLEPHNGYILYRTTNDEGVERYVAYRSNDFEPLVRAKDHTTLISLLDEIDGANKRAEGD